MALIWQKGILRVPLYVCSLSFKFCLWGKKNLFITFFFIVEGYIPLTLSPIFPVRGKSVRLVKQGVLAGALANTI